jgi:hypothetical protein
MLDSDWQRLRASVLYSSQYHPGSPPSLLLPRMPFAGLVGNLIADLK